MQWNVSRLLKEWEKGWVGGSGAAKQVQDAVPSPAPPSPHTRKNEVDQHQTHILPLQRPAIKHLPSFPFCIAKEAMKDIHTFVSG